MSCRPQGTQHSYPAQRWGCRLQGRVAPENPRFPWALARGTVWQSLGAHLTLRLLAATSSSRSWLCVPSSGRRSQSSPCTAVPDKPPLGTLAPHPLLWGSPLQVSKFP